MVKQSVDTPEMEVLGEVALSRTEQFFENNGKRIAITIFSLLVVAAALFSYKALVMDPAESRANEAIYSAQLLLESNTPDYQVAVEGDGVNAGFVDIANNYSSTKAGNIANHYAGVCYLKLGDKAQAERYLAAYKPQKGAPASIINAQNLALRGDIAVDNGSYTSAIELYKKAVKASENTLTAPLYLRKAAQASQAAGDDVQAKALYEQVVANYPSSIESRTAEKYLGRL